MSEDIKIYNPSSWKGATELCRGLWRKDEDGICKLRLHYTADPEKDPLRNGKEWLIETAQGMNPLNWAKEYEMDVNALSGGVIYPDFGDSHIIKSFNIPKHWTRYMSLDSGIRNQTAGLWGAVNPIGEIYLYREYYESDRDVRTNAMSMKYLEDKDENIFRRFIDPTTQNRSALTGTSIFDEYRKYGLYFDLSVNDSVTGIQRVKNKLKISSITDKPRIFVFENLLNLIYEFKNYRWQKMKADSAYDKNPVEKPQKVSDHLMNALEYLMQADIKYYDVVNFSDYDMYGSEMGIA